MTPHQIHHLSAMVLLANTATAETMACCWAVLTVTAETPAGGAPLYLCDRQLRAVHYETLTASVLPSLGSATNNDIRPLGDAHTDNAETLPHDSCSARTGGAMAKPESSKDSAVAALAVTPWPQSWATEYQETIWTNDHKDELIPGEKICQFVFLRCEGETFYQGQFQSQDL